MLRIQMSLPSRGSLAAALLVAAAVPLAAGCGEKVAPPLPRATGAWVDSLPPVPTSYLDVPVRYDLARSLAWLESAVPPVIGDIDQRHRASNNKRLKYAYSLRRRPFRVNIEGRTATLTADFDYQVRAWYNPPLLPEISASCGTDDDKPRPRARLVVKTNVELTDRWTLRPRTRALAEPLTRTERDQCEVTAFKVDVTGKVLGAARDALQKELKEFDHRLAAFDLPGEAGKVWKVLSMPLKLTDSLWLTINPSAVRIGLLAVRGDTLVTTVGLSANPRVIGGARPQYGRTANAPAAGFHRAAAGAAPAHRGAHAVRRRERGAEPGAPGDEDPRGRPPGHGGQPASTGRGRWARGGGARGTRRCGRHAVRRGASDARHRHRGALHAGSHLRRRDPQPAGRDARLARVGNDRGVSPAIACASRWAR